MRSPIQMLKITVTLVTLFHQNNRPLSVHEPLGASQSYSLFGLLEPG